MNLTWWMVLKAAWFLLRWCLQLLLGVYVFVNVTSGVPSVTVAAIVSHHAVAFAYILAAIAAAYNPGLQIVPLWLISHVWVWHGLAVLVALVNTVYMLRKLRGLPLRYRLISLVFLGIVYDEEPGTMLRTHELSLVRYQAKEVQRLRQTLEELRQQHRTIATVLHAEIEAKRHAMRSENGQPPDREQDGGVNLPGMTQQQPMPPPQQPISSEDIKMSVRAAEQMKLLLVLVKQRKKLQHTDFRQMQARQGRIGVHAYDATLRRARAWVAEWGQVLSREELSEGVHELLQRTQTGVHEEQVRNLQPLAQLLDMLAVLGGSNMRAVITLCELLGFPPMLDNSGFGESGFYRPDLTDAELHEHVRAIVQAVPTEMFIPPPSEQQDEDLSLAPIMSLSPRSRARETAAINDAPPAQQLQTDEDDGLPDLDDRSSTTPAPTLPIEREPKESHQADNVPANAFETASARTAAKIYAGHSPAAETQQTKADPSSSTTSSSCSICLCDFQPGQKLRVLKCGHRFHAEHLDSWLLSVSTRRTGPRCLTCNCLIG